MGWRVSPQHLPPPWGQQHSQPVFPPWPPLQAGTTSPVIELTRTPENWASAAGLNTRHSHGSLVPFHLYHVHEARKWCTAQNSLRQVSLHLSPSPPDPAAEAGGLVGSEKGLRSSLQLRRPPPTWLCTPAPVRPAPVCPALALLSHLILLRVHPLVLALPGLNPESAGGGGGAYSTLWLLRQRPLRVTGGGDPAACPRALPPSPASVSRLLLFTS